MSPEEAYKLNKENVDEMLSIMEEAIKALESVKDQATAKVAATKINSLADRMKVVVGKQDSLPDLTPAYELRLEKETAARFEAATTNLERRGFDGNARHDTDGRVSKALDKLIAAFGRD